jgi:acyl-CoA synthetase (AMP-forming)/AMP-acid ligase II|tara:strand:+ start:996 stop:2705 length:1710 start_codon:yes stop_codon:yes gene_type:complete
MIFASKDRIESCTAKGWWGSETLDQLFLRNVANNPDRTAVVDPDNRGEITHGKNQRLTYRELNRKVTEAAEELIKRGVIKDDIVVFQLPNIHESILMLLACSRVGALASPILVDFSDHELEQILGHLQPKIFVTVNRFKKRHLLADAKPICQKYEVICISVEDLDQSFSESQLEAAEKTIASHQLGHALTANDVNTLCWTSGTEGFPKAVMRTHNQWMVTGRAMTDSASIRDGDVILNARPLVNMAAIGGGLYSWLICGGSFVLHHPLSIPLVLEQLKREKVTLTFMPPAFIISLLQDPVVRQQADLRSLRTMGSGSAAIPGWAIENMKSEYDIDVINFFGSNEGISLQSNVLTVPDPTLRATYFPRLGRSEFNWPLSPTSLQMETKIVDLKTEAEITVPGLAGELRVKSSGIFDGYYKSPELTKAAFDENGFYRSGDLFEIAGDGELFSYYKFVGRCRELIVRGGMNIAPMEIDNLLSDHPLILDVAAFGYPDERLGEKIGVAIVAKSDQALSLEQIVEYLRKKKVAIFKLPQKVMMLDEMPRNAMMKISRYRLTELSVANDLAEESV